MNRALAAGYFASIFLGSFLLFQVQPIVGKALLPWFGGSPAVWTSCMLFFQVVLLAGYSYAHLVWRFLSPRAIVVLHSIALLVAVTTLPVLPGEELRPLGSEAPLRVILLILTQSLFLPYLLLAASSPFLQYWYTLVLPYSPYRLFALSNAASFLALLSYPFLIEPYTSLPFQDTLWSGLFVLYTLLSLGTLLASRLRLSRTAGVQPGDLGAKFAGLRNTIRWITPSACGVVLMLGATNELCQDIAVVPFLWIAPLALYLLTFVICFEYPQWYRRKAFLYAYLLTALLLPVVWDPRFQGPLVLTVLAFLLTVFLGCMLCHGELARQRPTKEYLTSYYLSLSLGGAIGGIFVGVVAPKLFHDFYEFPLALAYCPLLVLIQLFANDPKHGHILKAGSWRVLTLELTLAGLSLVAASLLSESQQTKRIHRDFFGVLRVNEAEDQEGRRVRTLVYGDTVHGAQYVSPELESTPLMYFGEGSAAGKVLSRFRVGAPRHIGIVGLGVGSMLAYTKKSDSVVIYELNPTVVAFAETYFTFLKNAEAAIEMRIGDGRLSLHYEESRRFDLLLLDAFSGDSIPAHLLTKEALELYLRHLKPDGVLVFQISNRYLDLAPVLRGASEALGLSWTEEVGAGQGPHLAPSYYMVLSPSRQSLEAIFGQVHHQATDTLLWTDAYSSLYSVIRG
ncbi:MAG: fused MFS/spermidine synthase [Bdellovibrionales bacterium]|nr:fused MFS/spermidine synthase [Bdellovibrionales bacterium]